MKGLLGTTPNCPSFSDLGGVVQPIQTPGRLFNPSINHHPFEGLAVVARLSNYNINPHTGVYEVSNKHRIIMNKSYFSYLKDDLSPIEWKEIVYVGGPELFRGPEDARLLVRESGWYLLVVLLENEIPKARMGLYKLDPSSGIASFTKFFDDVEDQSKPQKNWVFKSSGEDWIHNRDLGGNLRGGTPAIPYRDKYISVAHTTYYSKEKWYNPNTFGIMQVLKRSYTHRFVLHDLNLEVLKVSKEFAFTGAPIEFAAGLALVGTKMHISLGQNDASSLLASIDLDNIEKLFTGEK